jgi:hypothetical protein
MTAAIPALAISSRLPSDNEHAANSSSTGTETATAGGARCDATAPSIQLGRGPRASEQILA